VIFSATCTVAIMLTMAAAAGAPGETAADTSTRRLLDALDEREMPDVTLAVLERVASNPGASGKLRREIPFRRSAALVAISRREADNDKRASLLDEAQAALDEFLASGAPDDRQAIAAYTQKGSLLVERGRAKADQATRPGADAQLLRTEAVRFFDAGIAALKGTVKPGEPVTKVLNAEDAVIKVLREVNATIERTKGDTADGDKPAEPGDAAASSSKAKPKPKRPTPQQRRAQTRALTALAADQEALQSKLIQTRLLVADAVFKKASAYEPQSQEWKDTVAASGRLSREIADKYPTMGGGLLARCYQGRSSALLGNWRQAVEELAPVTVLDADSPLTVALRAKAVNTMLECLLAEKNIDGFQDVDRDFALSDVNRLRGGRLNADWLGLKYRAAVILDARASALDESDPLTKAERNRLVADARKLATEVARANDEFAAEARSLAAKLGKTVTEGEQTFSSVLALAKQSIGLMQASLAEAKAVAADQAKADAARTAAVAARETAVRSLREALTLAGADASLAPSPTLPKDVTIDEVNEARYLLAYLLYDSQDFEQAALMGRFLAEHFPNAKGSRQAARIALAAWQQLAQRAEGPAADGPRKESVELALLMMRTWPASAETADAAAVAIAAASAAHDGDAIATMLGDSPASPRRAEILLRGGSALWREVQQARRIPLSERPDETRLTAWKTTATQALEEGLTAFEGLAALPAPPLGPLVASGAIASGQLALDEGDPQRALSILEQPAYGPWTLAGGSQPAIKSGSVAEAALTLSLLVFIQTDDFARAQAAMKRLEDVAGHGAEASAQLTGMYLAMGRDLQQQLESLAGEAAAGNAASRDRARKILQGFTTFLDAVADRDQKTSSQIWVATTYLALGSGAGTGAVVPQTDADGYLRRAADAFSRLLTKAEDPDVTRFEPSIRLQLAGIQRRLSEWEKAREQLTWMLADPGRRNSLDIQVLAAEVLQGAAEAAATAGQTAKADRLFHEAVAGDNAAHIWGWAQIANRLERQGISASDERAGAARDTFFEARVRLVECLIERARLPGVAADARQKRLSTAETVISMTSKLHPDLGGEVFAKRFERLRQTINPDGQK
jgi:hypothetical protein